MHCLWWCDQHNLCVWPGPGLGICFITTRGVCLWIYKYFYVYVFVNNNNNYTYFYTLYVCIYMCYVPSPKLYTSRSVQRFLYTFCTKRGISGLVQNAMRIISGLIRNIYTKFQFQLVISIPIKFLNIVHI